MATEIDRHIDEATIEKYSMEALSEKVRARVEEHLLLCERCRQSVASSGAYVAAMRQAAGKLRQAARKPKSRGAQNAQNAGGK
jgi:anti-sigma factor RsiW